MLGGSKHWRGAGQLALGVHQVCGVEQVSTAVTLVPSCILHIDCATVRLCKMLHVIMSWTAF